MFEFFLGLLLNILFPRFVIYIRKYVMYCIVPFIYRIFIHHGKIVWFLVKIFHSNYLKLSLKHLELVIVFTVALWCNSLTCRTFTLHSVTIRELFSPPPTCLFCCFFTSPSAYSLRALPLFLSEISSFPRIVPNIMKPVGSESSWTLIPLVLKPFFVYLQDLCLSLLYKTIHPLI